MRCRGGVESVVEEGLWERSWGGDEAVVWGGVWGHGGAVAVVTENKIRESL